LGTRRHSRGHRRGDGRRLCGLGGVAPREACVGRGPSACREPAGLHPSREVPAVSSGALTRSRSQADRALTGPVAQRLSRRLAHPLRERQRRHDAAEVLAEGEMPFAHAERRIDDMVDEEKPIAGRLNKAAFEARCGIPGRDLGFDRSIGRPSVRRASKFEVAGTGPRTVMIQAIKLPTLSCSPPRRTAAAP
jgi:hypothetical protein